MTGTISKRVRMLAAGFALSGLLAVSSAHADNILYYCDKNLGTNVFPIALSDLGLSFTTASSQSDFVTKLDGGGWDLVILLQQGGTAPSTYPDVPTYVTGGGKMIFADWTENDALGAAFGIAYTAGSNQTSVTLDAAFLQHDIGSGLSLLNPGWATCSMDMTLTSAQEGANFADGAVAIAYTNTTIINGMLGDTLYNPDSPAGVQLAENEINRELGGPAPVVPEPASMIFFGIGLVGVVGYVARRRNR